MKKNINTINTFLQKYKTFNAAYQLKSDGSPTGDSLGINGGCLSVIDFLKKNAIDNENNDQIGDNNIIDNNLSRNLSNYVKRDEINNNLNDLRSRIDTQSNNFNSQLNDLNELIDSFN